MQDYSKFKITSWFSKPIVNPIVYNVNDNDNHFAVIGCSAAYGYQLLSYESSWASELSNILNLNHINLSMPGASMPWILDRLDTLIRQKSTELKFIIVQLTYTNWDIKSPRWFFGDINSRNFAKGNSEINIAKIKETLDKYSGYDYIYFTNIWNLDNKTLNLLKFIAHSNKQFIVNTQKVIDFGIDNTHSGPLTQLSLASFLSHNLKQYSSN